MSNKFLWIVVPLLLAILALTLMWTNPTYLIPGWVPGFSSRTPKKEPEKPVLLPYNLFQDKVNKGEIAEITIDKDQVWGSYSQKVEEGQPKSNVRPFKTQIVEGSGEKIARRILEKNPTAVVNIEEPKGNFWPDFLSSWLPFILLIGFWVFMMNNMKGGMKRADSFGKNRDTLVVSDQKKVTFKDVAGVDEAKEELQEIVGFLQEPGKYQKLGAKIPKGVLLMGGPGTGKTLLARAVAGEANVPFFSISGSDFVEMYVGVGASRVRSLFETGKKHAPCIVFVDEIDAVGRHRGTGVGGGHDEREQTLNQLLVEMDGFEVNSGVIIIAATNRPDILDPALLRAGRFDRQVVVPLPDILGREQILKIHTQKIPMVKDVELSVIARGTPGFSGAALANLVNEAAINAVKEGRKTVAMHDFENAKDKVLMGKERRSMVMSQKEKRVTAYHEAGHTLVAYFLPESDPVHKVTIIPRGMALGLTQQLPEEDKHSYSKPYLENRIAILMGGRAAEKLFFEVETTGASNDLETATQIAHNMITKYGMSEALGHRTFGKDDEHPFLGRSLVTSRNHSEATAEQIDKEIKRITDTGMERAEALLNKHQNELRRLALALLERETLDSQDIAKVIKEETSPA